MSRIRRVIATVIGIMLVSVIHVQAQPPGNTALELTEIHTTDAGWSFRYPDGWTVDESLAGIVLKNHDFDVTRDFSNIQSGDLLVTVTAGEGLSKLIGFPLIDESPSDALSEVVKGLGMTDTSSLFSSNTREFDIGDLPAAEFRISLNRFDFLLVLVHYHAGFWGLFVDSSGPDEMDTWKPTIYAIAASLSLPAGYTAGLKQTISTLNKTASFGYPDGWAALQAGLDGVFLATDATLLYHADSAPYQSGEIRIAIRISSKSQISLSTGTDLEPEAAPLKFLQAEIKNARQTPTGSLASVDTVEQTTIDGKGVAKAIVTQSSYAEEVWYIEYNPDTIIRMALFTAPDELAQGETFALTILTTMQYTGK